MILRAAQLAAWAAMAMTRPAYYSACVLVVLNATGAAHVGLWVILGLGLYAPAAIAFDVVVKALSGPACVREPGGRPGTESGP